MAKTKRRKASTRRRKRRVAPRRRKRNGLTKRQRAARKGARTRAANKRRRSAAAKKAARKRKRKSPSRRRRNPIRRRKRRTSARRRKATTRRRRRNPSRRRRTTTRRRRRNAVNGRRRRRTYSRRRRRNPGKWGVRTYRRRRRNVGASMSIKKILFDWVAPAAVSLYGARLISGKLSGYVPGLNMVPAEFRSPALAGGLFALGHYLTSSKSPIKVKMLMKRRVPIMIGLGINLIDKLISAFAPAEVKEMVGVGDYVMVDGVLPIQDDITMADYVQIGQYEGEGLEEDLGNVLQQDLGVLQQDLGVEMDLGDFANRHLGGVSRSSMAAPVGRKRYLAPVPTRSFTKPVPDFTDEFDSSSRVYTGIFAGGFGN